MRPTRRWISGVLARRNQRSLGQAISPDQIGPGLTLERLFMDCKNSRRNG